MEINILRIILSVPINLSWGWSSKPGTTVVLIIGLYEELMYISIYLLSVPSTDIWIRICLLPVRLSWS